MIMTNSELMFPVFCFQVTTLNLSLQGYTKPTILYMNSSELDATQTSSICRMFVYSYEIID